MRRVYIEIEGVAAEPVGIVHEGCEAELPASIDGQALHTEGGWQAGPVSTCFVCGERWTVRG